MKINRRISSNIELFEQKINYEFKNKEYILEALTHSSYSNENKNYPFNERLEFLGDSVLSIVISDYLFKKETKLPEGELTKIRANIVCEESLSEVSKNIHLGKYMLLGKGEEATGGRERISILADALEAVYSNLFSQALNPEYYSEFFPDLCDGRIGEFISVLEKSFTQLYSFKIKSLNVKDLHQIFFIVMDAYFNFLKLKKQYGIVPSQKIFEIVNSIHFQYSDSAYLNEITDTVLSLTGLAQPQHIYSHLICGVVNQTKELLTLIYKNQTMPNGSTAVLAKSVPNHNDKITLLKY